MNRSKRIWPAISLLFVLVTLGWFGGSNFLSSSKGPILAPGQAHAAETQYTCGMHPQIIQDEPGNCPICGMKLTPMKDGAADEGETPEGEKEIKYWVAPMDPTYIRDEPGKSPMGMDLVPVYEGEEPGGPTIRIDPVTQQNMGVRTAEVERRDLHRAISTVGVIDYEEPQVYSINAKVDGWIERLHVNQSGQKVKKGQPLLELYSPELVSAQEEYLLALNNRESLSDSAFASIAEGAERLLESSRKRLKYFDISERQIDRLETTGTVHKTMTLHSPYDGIVSMKMATEGEYIKAGKELFQIADISSVWIYADIYEYELPWVEVGQEAKVRLPFAGGKTLTARISYIYPYLDPKTRTVKARLEFPNPEFELKPDMYVNVRIKGKEVRDVLSVPAEAVINSGEKQRVFVALGEGKFEPRQVRIGLQDAEGNLQIKEGLFEGEKVVTSAQFLFDSESRLRESTSKMREPAPEHDDHAEESREDEDMEDEDLDDLF
ncbi:MAG: efflux RND transporter periplasmic adaptor subunit [Desulfuromonadales bacterium]